VLSTLQPKRRVLRAKVTVSHAALQPPPELISPPEEQINFDGEFDWGEDFDESADVMETSHSESIDFQQNDFISYCKEIGLNQYLSQVFATKDDINNTSFMENNQLDAEKRGAIAVNRCFYFILHCLQHIRDSVDIDVPTIAEDNLTVPHIITHVLVHFDYFVSIYFKYLRNIKGRKGNTLKEVLRDFDHVFVKYFLVSKEARKLFDNDSSVGYSTL
jgi:hypothetical protein